MLVFLYLLLFSFHPISDYFVPIEMVGGSLLLVFHVLISVENNQEFTQIILKNEIIKAFAEYQIIFSVTYGKYTIQVITDLISQQYYNTELN